MKKSILRLLAGAAVAGALPGAAFAEDPPPSPLTFNVGAVSDYRYRGISQTRLKPALQGGADYAFASGFYVGTWASSIKWVKDAYGDAQVEWDLYGGYKGEVVKDLGYDIGLLQYVYPGATNDQWNASYKNPNTTELYGALSSGPLTAKVSYALTNLFGNYDFAADHGTKGSIYLDLTASLEVGGGALLAPHLGYQKVKQIGTASYMDYSLTLSKDFNGLVPSIGVVGTTADQKFYVPGGAANSTQYLGKTAVVVGLKYNF